MDIRKRIFENVFAVIERDHYARANKPELLASALHSRDILVKSTRCACLDAPRCPVMPNCFTQNSVLNFCADIERLNVPVLNELLCSIDIDTSTGADLEQTLEGIIPVIKAFDDAYLQFGNDLLELPGETSKGGPQQTRSTSKRKAGVRRERPIRERSHCRIIWCLIHEFLAFDPDAKRSDTARRIEDITLFHKYPVRQDTIRQILKELRDMLGPEDDGA